MSHPQGLRVCCPTKPDWGVGHVLADDGGAFKVVAQGGLVVERIIDLGLELTLGLQTWDVKPPFTIRSHMTAQTLAL